MCRLIVYIGSSDAAISLRDLLLEPSHSILRQSFGSRERFGDGLSGLPPSVNADGFGIAWFGSNNGSDDATPGILTSTAPAWSDTNLHRLAGKVRSRLIFGHIRAASLGSGISPSNCHPFCCGKYLCMHNGHLGGFSDVPAFKREILSSLSDAALGSIRGTTDSEAFFAMVLTQIEAEERRITLKQHRAAKTAMSDSGASSGVIFPRPFSLQLSPESIRDCTMRALQKLQAIRRKKGIKANSLLNVCLTDGQTVIATRLVLGQGKPASLYFSSGEGWVPLSSTSTSSSSTSSNTVTASASASATIAAAQSAGDATLASASDNTAAGSTGSIFRRPSSHSSSATAAAAAGAAASSSSSSSSSAVVTCSSNSNPIASRGVDFTMVAGEKRSRCVIVASERLTPRDEDWLPVPPDTLLVIHPSLLTVIRVPLGGGVLDQEPVEDAASSAESVCSTAPSEVNAATSTSSSASTAETKTEAAEEEAAEAAAGKNDLPHQPRSTHEPLAPAPIFLRKRAREQRAASEGAAEDTADDASAAGARPSAKRSRVGQNEEEEAESHPHLYRLQMTCQGKALPSHLPHFLAHKRSSNSHDSGAAALDDEADDEPAGKPSMDRQQSDGDSSLLLSPQSKPAREAASSSSASASSSASSSSSFTFVWNGAEALLKERSSQALLKAK